MKVVWWLLTEGGDLFRRRSRGQVGPSRGNNVGHERENAGRKNYGRPVLGEYDLGYHVKGSNEVYDLCRQDDGTRIL